MADLAVGLAADCDNPESAVRQLLTSKLSGASTLPFVGFVTHDGKWVDGFSGRKAGSAFMKVLEKAENSPYLQATPAVRKKIAGLLKRAEKAAPKNDWKTVMKSNQGAKKLEGRCPERTALNALVDQGRAWAVKQFRAAIKTARDEGDTSAAHKMISKVKSQFRGEPEAEEATDGLAALRKLTQLKKIEARGSAPADIRDRAAKAYEGKRWAGLFGEGYSTDEDEDDGEESVIE
ncbi:MAG: hypothetical protein ACYS0E_17460 [Planctomycetota bacterium]|jgi:hypothetical protein